MSRLVVVSNRVGDVDNSTQTGGLAVAIADALRTYGGLWFGCFESSEKPEHILQTALGSNGVQYASTPVFSTEYQRYYAGYANSVLWPLFHYRTDLIDYREGDFRAYMSVNRQLANQLYPRLRADDIVWVHDYHLIPFARFLRRAGARNARVGFFLHIPFPPPDLLAASPNHASIVDSLLDYDLIGFQTSTDLSNFHRYLNEHAIAVVSADGTIRSGQRTSRSGRFPISIDVDSFTKMAEAAPEDVRLEGMRRHILKRKQIIGVDRLDYSKGIPARFEAFEKLISGNPSLEKSVSLLQISPPTREGIKPYEEIRKTAEGMASSINGRLADFNWTPIRYIHRTVARDKLAAILRHSDVGLVTPLRDGMNLVAKEYVAAQDPDHPGVLILSQFAGAAEDLTEALIVNPHDTDEMARCLLQALTMPLQERRTRHNLLLQRIRSSNVQNWANNFLTVLLTDARSDDVSIPSTEMRQAHQALVPSEFPN